MASKYLKIFITIITILAGLLIMEAGYFFWVFSRAVVVPKNIEADAVIVFNGGSNHVKAGYEIVQSLNTRYLVISSASKSHLATFDRKYKLQSNVRHIEESLARTTMENAAYCQKIVGRHKLKSIVLVTSAYHMPRSLAMLNLCMLGKAANAKIYCAPVGLERNVMGYFQTSKGLKTIYNEMVRFWGSLVEFAAFKIRGKLPEKNPKDLFLVKDLKSILLFDISVCL